MIKFRFFLMIFSVFFFCFSQCLIVQAAQIPALSKLQGKKIAAQVYPQGETNVDYKKSAQAHLESILRDNGVVVLDEEKAKSLKDIFPGLENPAAFVTAETFIENANKFEIDGILAVYLKADTVPGIAGYYSATAQADVRYIDKDAKVQAETDQPMGTPGYPPSDGLTKDSAMINAIQRSLDKSCEKVGFRVVDPVRPKFINVKLNDPKQISSINLPKRYKENDQSLTSYAALEKQTWTKEQVTSTAISSDRSLSAVAGYITDTDFNRRPQRMFGSRVHLIDLRTKRQVNTFDCHPLGKKEREEEGTREIYDIMFLSNWRFLAAVTGNMLFLWETESGRLMDKVFIQGGIKDGELNFTRISDKGYLILDTNRGRFVYELVTL